MGSNSAVPSGRSVHSGTKADSQNTYDTDSEVPPTAMELRAKERHAEGVESTVPHSAVKDNQRQLPYDTDLGPTAMETRAAQASATGSKTAQNLRSTDISTGMQSQHRQFTFEPESSIARGLPGIEMRGPTALEARAQTRAQQARTRRTNPMRYTYVQTQFGYSPARVGLAAIKSQQPLATVQPSIFNPLTYSVGLRKCPRGLEDSRSLLTRQ